MPKKLPATPKKPEDEDSFTWQDTDKLLLKKQQRKEDQIRKRELQLSKRAETKLLLEKETDSLRSGKSPFHKLTRAQIGANARAKKEEEGARVLEENLNMLKIEGVARSVDEAIGVFQGGVMDKHPERRRKAAFAVFEKRRIKELKAEKPELRLSQLKEIVFREFREWQKSPENPVNVV